MSGIQQFLLTHGSQQSETFEALPTAGATTDFVVPVGVTSISIYAVGGGGGGSIGGSYGSGACGGGLVWTDGVSVTPGETLIVGVGTGGHGQRRVYQGIDQYGNAQWCDYDDCNGHTSYVKRQSNNKFIVKAYGGGYYGSEGGGGEGMFTEGTGVIQSGGDGYRWSMGGTNPQVNFTQGGDSSYKGQPGGNNSSTGSYGVSLSPGKTGSAGDPASGGNEYGNGATGGDGGKYGGGGGMGVTSGGLTGYGGYGGDGGVRISWDNPISDGTDGAPYIDGKYSVQYKGAYYYQYMIVTPPTPNYFQLGDSDWTIEFWWRPGAGAPGQSYWGNNGGVGQNSPYIEGLDDNNRVTWKIAPYGVNSPAWYHQNQAQKDAYNGTGEDADVRWYFGGDHIMSHDGENGSGGWRHIIFERIGTTGLYFLSGGTRTHQYSGTNSDLFQLASLADLNDTSTTKIAIGGHGQGSGPSAAMAGMISNVRVVTGRAVYGQDRFNSARIEPLKQIPGTKLLACNGPTVDTVYFGLDENTVVGQKEYTVVGTHSWICPADVTSVCVVCVGGGGGSSEGIDGGTSTSTGGEGGAGGGLGWKNNISVTPGQSYTVVVGDYGAAGGGTSQGNPGGNGQDSYFINTSTVKGGGGDGGGNGVAQGGDYVGDGGGNGGNGGGTRTLNNGTGGGGAGGYSGNGGNGATSGAGQDGTGGGAGGGGSDSSGSLADGRYGAVAGGGGGTGIWGEGSNGVGGGDDYQAPTVVGKGGSEHWLGVTAGVIRRDPANGGWLNGDGRHPPYSQGEQIYTGAVAGGYYGGGAGADCGPWGPAGEGAPTGGGASFAGCSGAVRIIWGSGRSFPSTNTKDLKCAIYGYNAAAAPNSYGGAEDPEVKTPSGSNPDNHPFGTYNGGVS
tara:strand:+ start:962 stop:3637 length:2676 start_codon:yes stop_codon:yes gene_type:complete